MISKVTTPHTRLESVDFSINPRFSYLQSIQYIGLIESGTKPVIASTDMQF
jgi:hypothetical protein